MLQSSVFQRYLNTLSPKDEIYLKKNLPDIFRQLCTSVNGDMYSDKLKIQKGPSLSAEQISIIALEWSRCHETVDVCEMLGVDFFEISTAICFCLDPTLKNNKIGKIDVLKFLKYAQITPALALRMLRALVDHQIKQLHEILAAVPCLPSEMIIAIAMYRLYTTRHFSRDQEWNSLEIAARNEEEFKRKFQESLKMFSEFKRLHKEQLALAANAERLQKFNFSEFAEEVDKMSTKREKRVRINEKIDELKAFQKANNGHYKNHLTFLNQMEQQFPELLKERLSVSELMQSMSLQPIPKYEPDASTYVSVDPVKTLSKFEDIKFAFRKVECYDESSQADTALNENPKQKQARRNSRNSSADEEENPHHKVEQKERKRQPSSSKSCPQSTSRPASQSTNSKSSTSVEGSRSRVAHQPKNVKNEEKVTYVSPLKDLRSSAQPSKLPTQATKSSSNPKSGPSRAPPVKVLQQNPRKLDVKHSPTRTLQTPVKSTLKRPNDQQNVLTTPGRYDFDLEDNEPALTPPVKTPPLIDPEARRRLANNTDSLPIPAKQAKMQANSNPVNTKEQPINPEVQHRVPNCNDAPSTSNQEICNASTSSYEQLIYPEARRRLMSSSDEEEPQIPKKQARMQTNCDASTKKDGPPSTSTSKPKEAHKIAEKQSVPKTNSGDLESNLKSPILSTPRKDPLVSHQSASSSRSTQRIGTPSKLNLTKTTPAFVSKTSNPPQIDPVRNELNKVGREREVQKDGTSVIAENASNTTKNQLESLINTDQNGGHSSIFQTKNQQSRQSQITKNICNIKLEPMDLQDLAQQSTSNSSKQDETQPRETTGTVLQKIIKQEIMSPRREQHNKPAPRPSNEVRFPSLTFESLSQRLQPGGEIILRQNVTSPEYVKGVFKQVMPFNGADHLLEVQFNGTINQVSAKQVAFAVPLEPQNLSILMKGVRVVVEVVRRFKDEPLPEFPDLRSGSIGHKQRSENGEFLVFLDEGIPYYAKADNIHLIVQQPVSIDGQVNLEKAAREYPETPNAYHTFVRSFFTQKKLRRLALESYQIDSKHPFPLIIREHANAKRSYTSILLLVHDELVLLRKPKNDKRLKDRNVLKKVADCRVLECHNSKCAHTDEWIHRSDATRFPHLDSVNIAHRE